MIPIKKMLLIEIVLGMFLILSFTLSYYQVDFSSIILALSVFLIGVFYFPVYPVLVYKNYKESPKGFTLFFILSYFFIGLSLNSAYLTYMSWNNNALNFFKGIAIVTAICFWIGLFKYNHSPKLLITLLIVLVINTVLYL